MNSTEPILFPTRAGLLRWSMLCLIWLMSLPALAAPQTDPVAAENKAGDKTGQAEKKDADDPFAPTQPNQGGGTLPKPAEPNTTKAAQAKRSPIDDRIDFAIRVMPRRARRGETVQLTITGTPKPGFHTYPLTQRAGNPAQDISQLSTLKYGSVPGLQPLWPITESDPQPKLEEELGWFLEH